MSSGLSRIDAEESHWPSRWPEPRQPQRDVMALLAAIVADSPNLESAACRHRQDLFDAAANDLLDEQAIVSAVGICERCPVTERCASFAEQDKATGVFSGQVYVAGRAYTIEQWITA